MLNDKDKTYVRGNVQTMKNAVQVIGTEVWLTNGQQARLIADFPVPYERLWDQDLIVHHIKQAHTYAAGFRGACEHIIEWNS